MLHSSPTLYSNSLPGFQAFLFDCVRNIKSELPPAYNKTGKSYNLTVPRSKAIQNIIQLIKKALQDPFVLNLAASNSSKAAICTQILENVDCISRNLPKGYSYLAAKKEGGIIVAALSALNELTYQLSVERVFHPQATFSTAPPPPLLVEQKSEPPKALSRTVISDYKNTPSLNLSEWYEFYWWPQEHLIRNDEIKSGFSTLAVVLIGKNESMRVYFFKEGRWLEDIDRITTQPKYLSISITLAPEELLLLSRRNKQGYQHMDRSNPWVASLQTKITNQAGLVVKAGKRETPPKESSFYIISQQNKLTFSKTYAVEHASRRVDLLFYLFVYYYRHPATTITIGTTQRQYGQGVNLREGNDSTHAAHSSLLPSLNDVEGTPGGWTLSHLEFSNILNSTVELPVWFNHFDTHYLERKNRNVVISLRDKVLQLLNLVSQKEITPLTALSQFFIHMQEHIEIIQWQYLQNPKAKKQSPTKVRQGVLEAEREGTFSDKWDHQAQQCYPSYIASLLRVPINDWHRAMASTSEDERNFYYDKIYKEIAPQSLNPEEKSQNASASFPVERDEKNYLMGQFGDRFLYFEEHQVARDGDCGFIVIGTSRQELTNTLITALEESKHDLSEELYPELCEFIATLDEVKLNVCGESIQKAHQAHLFNGNAPTPENEKIFKAILASEEFLHDYLKMYTHVPPVLDPPLWLGYQTAKWFAKVKQSSLYIWKKDPTNANKLILDRANSHQEESQSEQQVFHIIHTAGFTHFNLLSLQPSLTQVAETKPLSLILEEEYIKNDEPDAFTSLGTTRAEFVSTLMEELAALSDQEACEIVRLELENFIAHLNPGNLELIDSATIKEAHQCCVDYQVAEKNLYTALADAMLKNPDFILNTPFLFTPVPNKKCAIEVIAIQSLRDDQDRKRKIFEAIFSQRRLVRDYLKAYLNVPLQLGLGYQSAKWFARTKQFSLDILKPDEHNPKFFVLDVEQSYQEVSKQDPAKYQLVYQDSAGLLSLPQPKLLSSAVPASQSILEEKADGHGESLEQPSRGIARRLSFFSSPQQSETSETSFNRVPRQH